VRANDRIRDHFAALPPEDPYRAASVEDLTQTITIFRADVGASRLDDASRRWEYGLGHKLLVDIGAYSTVTELLGPLAAAGSVRVRGDLAIAFHFLNRHDETINQVISILADHMWGESDATVIDSGLTLLASSFWSVGALASADRCFQLREALADAAGSGPRASLILTRAVQAISCGQPGRGRELLEQAAMRGPGPNNPWFEDSVLRWRLYLALVADGSLTSRQLADAAARAQSRELRRAVAALACELYQREEQLERALAASEELDQLGRTAGRDIAPARTAFILARLGRTPEARAAVEDILSRLPLIQPAHRPHYHLAMALRELGRHGEAASHARLAYRQAWADGPPNSRHWDLREASRLLRAMGEPPPELPTIEPASVKIPFEAEIRAFITKVKR
jgi:tetratricopeptide (TPR) repeat protein